MKKESLWRIPCAFFLLCVLLNLAGCIWADRLAQTVKPALLPLLALTTLAYLAPRPAADGRKTALLAGAQLLGFAGDTLLIGNGLAFFGGGMAAFLAGHVCYLCLFGGESWKRLKTGTWILSLALMLATVFTLIALIGIRGALFVPMAVYGTGLMLLIFSGLMGVVRKGTGNRTAWWLILAGALLFTFSDAQIALRTAGAAPYALRGFVIMLTYLAAQVLLALGGIRLALGNR